jgi:F-type H+-transporting ATPase subunit gamma
MLNFVPKFCFSGGNLKALKIRMNSVSSIKKITKAMKMVAAAKMRVEVRRLDEGKDFAVGSVQKIMDNESYL